MKCQGKPYLIAANGSAIVNNQSSIGFLCKTAGALTITSYAGDTIVNAVAVAAGEWIDLPFYIDPNGFTVTLSGGAAGTFCA